MMLSSEMFVASDDDYKAYFCGFMRRGDEIRCLIVEININDADIC